MDLNWDGLNAINYEQSQVFSSRVRRMANRCPRCNSTSVRFDRSLAGRAVCGSCGMALGLKDISHAGRLPIFRTRQGPKHQNAKIVIAWLIPASLLGSYLYIWANPRAVSRWMAPYSESARNSWHIATPADIELLIGKAQQSSDEPPSQAKEDAIRAIANTLIAKGVRVLISNQVMPNAGAEWAPAWRELRIRPSTVSMGTATLAQALAHEAAHVAQSCRAGGIGKNSEPMGIPVDPAKTYQRQLDSDLYKGPVSKKAVELEAYSVGAQPEWAPKLLDHFCK